MRKSMRGVVVAGLVTAVAMAVGCTSSAPVASTVPADTATLRAASGEAEVLAVAMHADWCGACRTLGPAVQQAVENMGDARVRIVKADLTDRRNPAGAQTLAGYGLSNLYEANGGKTGVVYFIDADTGETLGTVGGFNVTPEMVRAEAGAALAKAGA